MEPPVVSAPGTLPVCKCGRFAVEKRVRKEGRNKGRSFFCCGSDRDEQCGYFEWR